MSTREKWPTEEELSMVRTVGVIEPARLTNGTVLLIETVKHVFEFKVTKKGMRVSSSNDAIFTGAVPCKISGSSNEDGTLYAGMIVKDLHLIIDLMDRGRYVTGLIKSASLQGKGWKYEMWQ